MMATFNVVKGRQIFVISKFIRSVDDPGHLTEAVKDACSVALCFVIDMIY